MGFVVVFIAALVMGSPFLLHGLMAWRTGAKETAVGEWSIIGLIALVSGVLALF